MLHIGVIQLSPHVSINSSVSPNTFPPSLHSTIISTRPAYFVTSISRCCFSMSNYYSDEISRPGPARLNCDDDEILHDVSNLRLANDNKFHKVVGTSPPIQASLSSDAMRTMLGRTSNFFKPTPYLPPLSPSRSSKCDIPGSGDYGKLDSVEQPFMSFRTSQPKLGSPVRSDTGYSLESLITKQPAAVSTSVPSFADSSMYTRPIDVPYQTFRKSPTFPQAQSTDPQSEIEMLRRQLEFATKKIEQIQSQVEQQQQQGLNGDASYGPTRAYQDSISGWNSQSFPTLEKLEQRDLIQESNTPTMGAQFARSYSPGTYQPSTSIWGNQSDTREKNKYNKWNPGSQTLANNPGTYSFKSSAAETFEPDPWLTPDINNPGIYENSFRSGGFTPNPKALETDSQDGGFAQDVCYKIICRVNRVLTFPDVLPYQILQRTSQLSSSPGKVCQLQLEGNSFYRSKVFANKG